jgi:hypothetical protein
MVPESELNVVMIQGFEQDELAGSETDESSKKGK